MGTPTQQTCWSPSSCPPAGTGREDWGAVHMSCPIPCALLHGGPCLASDGSQRALGRGAGTGTTGTNTVFLHVRTFRKFRVCDPVTILPLLSHPLLQHTPMHAHTCAHTHCPFSTPPFSSIFAILSQHLEWSWQPAGPGVHQHHIPIKGSAGCSHRSKFLGQQASPQPQPPQCQCRWAQDSTPNHGCPVA